MPKRLVGQSAEGERYTALLRTQLRKRTRGMCGTMGVEHFVVFPVLQVGDWRPVKGLYR